jgi:formyl-CoA transferase/succinyl-CoA--D-citramalate CoA-transferase
MVHVSGFGRSGPRAEEAGFGSIGEAAGGIRHTTGDADRLPSRAGISLGDALAALFAVIGTLSALHERARSGRGQEVDVAIAEAVFALMESTVADYELAGVMRGRSGGVLPGVSPSNAYPTADGDLVVIAANADAVYARLTDAMQRSDLARDPRFADHAARGVNMAELDELISAWTVTLSTDALLETLRAHAVPAGRIQTAADLSGPPARGTGHGAPPCRRLRAAGRDGGRRAEAVAHPWAGCVRRPRARSAHRRGAARSCEPR